MKYTKLKEDWMVIIELLRQHKERTAELLLSKKTSETFFKILWIIMYKQVYRYIIGLIRKILKLSLKL